MQRGGGKVSQSSRLIRHFEIRGMGAPPKFDTAKALELVRSDQGCRGIVESRVLEERKKAAYPAV